MRAPAAVVLAMGLVALPAAAHAFCRTRTVPVVADFQPSPDKCWDQGVPLFWRNSCVSYSINRAASRQVALEDAANHISRAFTKWTGSSCPTEGGGASRVSIDVRDLGPVDCGEVSYNQNGGNQNVIIFRDDEWPHHDSSNTLALTTVTFNPDTGEIYDADMEINTHDQKVTVNDPVPPDGYDFASIVTHETGHFLGLAHSGDIRATMYANYQPGTTAMRNLTSDDVAGICSIYLPDGTRTVLDGKVTQGPSCDPTPRRGFTGECAEAPKKGLLGCGSSTVAPTRAPAGVLGWLALGVLTSASIALRRIRARRAR